MKTKELRALTDEELEAELARLGEEAFNLRFQLATKQLVNYNRLRQVGRDMAQVKTILRERSLFGAQEVEG